MKKDQGPRVFAVEWTDASGKQERIHFAHRSSARRWIKRNGARAATIRDVTEEKAK